MTVDGAKAWIAQVKDLIRLDDEGHAPWGIQLSVKQLVMTIEELLNRIERLEENEKQRQFQERGL